MLFNSLDFAIFLPLVFICFWTVVKYNAKFQNLVLLLASYIFYAWWDYKFLGLIVFSSCLDFIIGLLLFRERNDSIRLVYVCLSIVLNIGLLMLFKYFNFFIDNFNSAFSLLGSQLRLSNLDIILPVGISFYTFQTLSYTLDIYRRKIEPTQSFVAFLSFVSFFPQLVAGPIERASNLLPQFMNKKEFDYDKAKDGLRQMLWGLFKKVVIADNCANYVDLAFNGLDDHSGSTLLLGAVLFSIQIYCDFSGYSDIAIGLAKLFGFDLMKNFNYPYFSRDIGEFWRRWHISLSTWFRDYIYIPLGGSRGSQIKTIRNVFIIFLVSGFWHGANWTFIFWGLINALFFIPLMMSNSNRTNLDVVAEQSVLPNVKEFAQVLSTFIIVSFIWILFRADSMSHAVSYYKNIFSASLFFVPLRVSPFLILFIIILFVFEWLSRKENYGLAIVGYLSAQYYGVFLRWTIYFILSLSIAMFIGEKNSFIYFQF